MADRSFNFQDRLDEARDDVRYRLRSALTMSNLWATLRTLLWLAPLTILVWYTAESSRRETQQWSTTIRVRAQDPNRQVIKVEPDTIQVEFRGTRSQRVQFTSRPLQLVLTDAGETGLVIHAAETLVSRSDARRESGVTIQRVTPQELRINVDEVIERELVVTQPPSVNNLQSASFDPPTVVVRGPASVLNAAEANGTLVATADIAGLAILRTPGRKEPLNVPVRSPIEGQPGVSIQPDHVVATLEVRESDIPHRIGSVPVFVALPPEVINDYRVTVEPQLIFNVTVYGSPDAINNLRAQENNQVIARIDFLPDEVDAIRRGQSGTKQPRFVLPEGIRVDPEVARGTTITWSSQRREN